MRIPIKAVRELSRKYGLSHVIVFGYDGKRQHVATWGRTIEASPRRRWRKQHQKNAWLA